MLFLYASVVTLVVSFVSGAHGLRSDPGCGSLTACKWCTKAFNGQCGWCESTQLCTWGTDSGPKTGSCSGIYVGPLQWGKCAADAPTPRPPPPTPAPPVTPVPTTPATTTAVPPTPVPSLRTPVPTVPPTPGSPTSVNTTTGNYVGQVNDEFSVVTFKGIRYAAPPTGPLRFVAPTELPYPPHSVAQPIQAFDFGAMCCQRANPELGLPQSEDCLFLNVFTPSNAVNNASSLLPVIFYIHGGGFMAGSSNKENDGTEWASREQAIIVTINYRLNIFGGLTLTSESIEGNFQLQDQRMALNWVQENIAQFGGDKTKVMISGESAGAESVGMHLVSPQTWSMYSSAAVISSYFAIDPLTQAAAESVGQQAVTYLGCSASNNQATVLQCLQNLTAKDILEATWKVHVSNPKGAPTAWAPHHDGNILPHRPMKAVQRGHVANVPLYIGTMANETVPFIYDEYKNALSQTDLERAIYADYGLAMAKKIMAAYSPLSQAEKKDGRLLLSRMQTDYSMYCSTRRFILDLGSQTGGGNYSSKIYNYLYDEVPSWAHYFHPNTPCGSTEVCHAMALPFIFDTVRYKVPGAQPIPDEKKLIKFMQTAWVTLAKTGSMQSNPLTASWKPFNNATLLAFNLSVPLPTPMLSGYRAKYCDFWDSYGYDHNDN